MAQPGFGLDAVQEIESGIGIGLQNALERGQVGLRMDALRSGE
jgi:hypothetical protein